MGSMDQGFHRVSFHHSFYRDPLGIITIIGYSGQILSGWWFGTFFFYIYWESYSQLTNIFQRG